MILVDAAIWRWRGRRWAHLISDESYEELHAFADGLGLTRSHFQGDHYDVPAEMRDEALARGAVAVTAAELVRRLRAAGLRRPRREMGDPWAELIHPDHGEAYAARLAERAAAGEDLHGEADFVSCYTPSSVLDAGCGTGRVGIELARRGVDVVGVDRDEAMLAVARREAPQLHWVTADLASLDLGRRFDVAVAAGNVLLFCTPGTEPAIVDALARHLGPGGRLVTGFQIVPGRITAERYEALCVAAGLEPVERYATWDREPWHDDADYVVSVSRSSATELMQ